MKILQGIIITLVGGATYNFSPETGMVAAGFIGTFVAIVVTVLPLRIKWWLERRRERGRGRYRNRNRPAPCR